MNILHITNELTFADGVSSHIYYLLKELNNNFDVNIFLAYGGGSAIDKFKRPEIKMYELENLNHKNRSLKNFASAIISVSKLVKQNNIHIIHSHNHYAANISHRSSKFNGAKTLQTIHGIIPEGGRLKHFISPNYIAVNDHVFSYLKNFKKEKQKLHLIYNGIEFNEDLKKKKNSKLIFISASRLEEGKGIEIFIEAVSKLPASYRSKAKFIIAGEGSVEKHLKSLNKKFKTDIEFLGIKTNVQELLNMTDVLIVSSEKEGFPMTMLEAASSNNLIISSDFNGVRNIFNEGDEGLIFEVNNPNKLADKIKFAIDNPEFVARAAERFYRKAREKFNSNVMAKKHYELYKNILN